MVENSLSHSKDIIKMIEDIMKCDICNTKYDYDIHKPMVIKCGHTFCKSCIYNSKDKNSIINKNIKNKSFKCPFDRVIQDINFEKSMTLKESTIYQNLKLEIILKEVLKINEPKIKEKHIIYTKPDMKRTKSPENNNKNTINNNSENYNNNRLTENIKINDDSNYKKKDINIKINSGNQIINVNAVNVNIDTRDVSKKGDNKRSELKKNNLANTNNNDSLLNDDLNKLNINEEMNERKFHFENEKINDESIETIPLNDEKSMTNMSFRDDFKELLSKNDEFKNQISGSLKTNENNNDIILNNGIQKKAISNLNNIKNNNFKKTMKSLNKIGLQNENNNSNNKYNIKLTEPNKEDNIKNFNDDNKNNNNFSKNNNPEKVSNYSSKKIIDLNSNENKDNNNDYNKNNKGMNSAELEINDKDRNSDNIVNKIKKNELNLNEIDKNDMKDILRKTNYYELNKNNIINTINNNTTKKIILNKQANIISLHQLKREKKNNKPLNNASPIKNDIKPQLLNSSGMETESKNIKSINHNLSFNNSNEEDIYEKNYRKNRTVFRKKKNINYDDNMDYINDNCNSTRNNQVEYENEGDDNMIDINIKGKDNHSNKFLFPNSPNAYNKKTLIGNKNIYLSSKSSFNSTNKANEINIKNKNKNINNNEIIKEEENINNQDESKNNNNNNNLYNNKKIRIQNIQKFKTINNRNSNINNKIIINNNNNSNNSSNNMANNSIGLHLNSITNNSNNTNTNQNIINNTSYEKKSQRETINNALDLSTGEPGSKVNEFPSIKKTEKSNNINDKNEDSVNPNIISIYIKMNNKNKDKWNIDKNKEFEQNLTSGKNTFNKNKENMSSSKLDKFNSNKNNYNSKINSELSNNNIELKNIQNEQRYSNIKINKLDNIKLKQLRKDFEIFLRKEKIYFNKDKYTKFDEYYEKFLRSHFLKNTSEDDLENIKFLFLRGGDFFIGFLENNASSISFPIPKKGVLFSLNGDYYEGNFINGKKEGNGIIIYKNGTIYEGDLKRNRHHGFGKLTQLDGEIFIGEWKEGKIYGNGIRYHSNGDRYVGNYVNNIRCGKGHYIFANGDSYEGKWINGKANGQGKFVFKNGNIYEGEFKDNIISGKGCFTMKNGDIYSGIFVNGLINGKGTYINKKGEKYDGYFKNGKKDGEGNLYDKDGKIIKTGVWIQDKFIS